MLIERGKGIYVTTCAACHGADLRGGATGGPNLLRSQVVLNDQKGELILPIVHGARAERGMPALPLGNDDIEAVAEYIHSVAARGRTRARRRRPTPRRRIRSSVTRPPVRSTSGRTAARATPPPAISPGWPPDPDGKALQNGWITGAPATGRGGRGGRGGGAG